jgi:hypothetical protein
MYTYVVIVLIILLSLILGILAWQFGVICIRRYQRLEFLGLEICYCARTKAKGGDSEEADSSEEAASNA